MRWTVSRILTFIVSAATIGIAFERFSFFVSFYLIVLSFFYFLKEWRPIPILSILGIMLAHNYILTSSPFRGEVLPLFIIVLSLPFLILGIRYDKKGIFPTVLFCIALGLVILPLTTLEEFIVIFFFSLMISRLLDYRGVIIAGITFLLISIFRMEYSDISYFYLLGGVISAILVRSERKVEIYEALSLFSVLIALTYTIFKIPIIFLSIGLGLFFPPSLIFSSIILYLEGFRYALYLTPIFIIPYLWKSKLLDFTLISIGLSMLFPFSIPFMLVLSKFNRTSLLISSIVLSLATIYLFSEGYYDINIAISSIICSAIFLASFKYDLIVRYFLMKRFLQTLPIILVGISSILVLFFYYYIFSYVALAVSLIYFLIIYEKKILENFDVLKYSLLVVFSILLNKYYFFLPLSGYYLKNKLNFVMSVIPIIVSITLLNDVNITLVALFSSLSYFLQSLRNTFNVKPLSYILPSSILIIPFTSYLKTYSVLSYILTGNLFPLFISSIVIVTLCLITYISSYLLGRSSQYLGIIYGISLGVVLSVFASKLLIIV
ncbi:hypothetical protein BFU36_11295 [Sulfolobus sp. A20]|uniref:hypothetical protein n=1 Tax=Saccharolobus sp. A20 TaxID=1891280 RepID=UPI0008460127|nr:hypothetical protein [Sulfolobus sp. A20]TRM76940.1 hypothetical protein DJ523_00125 [Sulfolobus sp. E5]TRM78663.1 hypothetical protein DJ528_04380 [Sulfolobus sp. B5]TRM82445.1 hypothetical protein DJ524_00475 [Sulfolobus sp. D5]TRM84078.1 hypothetical protein DJ531_02130 [Sulfolobus sp. A20-N-F6]TRM88245.1 hypothetical protein DJ529_05955 [Sulfolobus sp. C3]TRN01493.1 hypothetical protein DJ530_05645 [Sulfolobus sp. E1]TRN04011.1 hypothetical protein DJ527_01055 [Sulfolobus sp. F1]